MITNFYSAADDCNYWYDQVPKSSNQTNCSTRMGDSITLTCAVYHPCGNISIDWYKNDSQGQSNIWDRGERIDDTSDKYILVPLTGTNAMATNSSNFDNTCCFASSLFQISRFFQNDTGYYWCQIVTPNRQLQNSPYAFISLHHETVADPQPCVVDNYTNHLNPPICATVRNYNNLPNSGRRSCNSTNSPTEAPTTMSSISHLTTHSTTGSTSYDSTYYDTMGETTPTSPVSTNQNSQTTSTAVPTSSNRDMLWIYLLMAGVVTALVVVFVVCFVIFYLRYRTLQKQGKLKFTELKMLSSFLTYTATVNATGEGATAGGRAGYQVKLHKNISYNKVTLKESNELRSTTTPTGASSQINSEGQTLLDTPQELGN